MKRLIVLMIVLIPAAVFAAKDASSSSIYPKGMAELCQDLKKDARAAASSFVFWDKEFHKRMKNKKRDEARRAGNQSDLILERAAQVSTVYSVLCK